MKKRSHVTHGNSNINHPHDTIASNGTQGTNGVRKGRARVGSARRKITIPAATSTKANRVPMLHNSTTSLMFVAAEKTATSTPVKIVVTCGVRNLGCTLAAHWGSKPSRAMEKKMRGWPKK